MFFRILRCRNLCFNVCLHEKGRLKVKKFIDIYIYKDFIKFS